jgi:hypothetical protein
MLILYPYIYMYIYMYIHIILCVFMICLVIHLELEVVAHVGGQDHVDVMSIYIRVFFLFSFLPSPFLKW